MTQRIQSVTDQEARGKVTELFGAVKAKLGKVPNMMRAMASSPAALEGYLSFSGALSNGLLDAKVREQVALVTAETNACDYCLAAHSAIGGMVGLSQAEITGARRGSIDGRAGEAIRFASEVVENRGDVSDEALDRLRKTGFKDGEITELVANVALNILTNYFNKTAKTEVDFPLAAKL